MFAWYWLADLCEDEGIPFVLGHALYMKAIHGGKTKNDKIDAAKIAGLLRGGIFPRPTSTRRPCGRPATCCAAAPSSSASAPTHRPHAEHQQPVQPPPPAKKLSYAANRGRARSRRFADPSTRTMLRADLA